MTKKETSERYGIPKKILDEYESWGLCGPEGMEDRQYDEADIQRLNLILTLHDVGFTSAEAETYMRLMLEGDSTGTQRLLMLGEKRQGELDEIHFHERQLGLV